MEGNYCIAYIDKNGNGFSSYEPWIIEYSDDLTECKVEASELLKDGNQDITIFMFHDSDKEKMDSITWGYVKRNKVLIS